MKICRDRLRGSEEGQALVLVLLFMLIGALVVTPLLQFMGTGVKAGTTFESKMDEIYAADAGINDGFWQIKEENLEALFPGPSNPYDPYIYGAATWTYSISSDSINGFGGSGDKPPVTVSIKNVFIPDGYVPNAPPSAADARTIIEGPPTPLLTITGSPTTLVGPSTPGTYTIRTILTDPLDDFGVTSIGIWLPPSFTYVTGSSNLESAPGNPPYHSVPTVSPYKGGFAIVWDFVSVPFEDFPAGPAIAGSEEKDVIFSFSGPEDTSPGAVSWINTDRVPDSEMPLSYTWDGGKKVFQVTSTADDPDRPGQTVR